MKLNQTTGGWGNEEGRNSFGRTCASCCKGILAQITKIKETVLAEARGTLKGQDQLLRLALNEAEALAWQTLYPQLIFPALAEEKVRGVAAWSRRQQLLAKTQANDF